jgi:hypothetical protein
MASTPFRSQSTYHHLPLNPNKPHIRLLELLPGAASEEVNLKLDIVPLDDTGYQYDAISYMWGPVTPEYKVKIGSKSLSVRANIWEFFHHCRKNKNVINRLWIDAICINQKDNAEKASQIRYMDHVFSRAERVLIWLGKDVSELPEMSSVADKISIRNAQGLKADQSCFSELGENGRMELRVDMLQEYFRLISSEYWWRLWIIQEMLLNARTLIIAGHSFLDLAVIIEVNRWIWSRPLKDANDSKASSETIDRLLIHIRKLLKRADVYRERGPQRLSDLVFALREQLCENPRDMIYGILSLVSHETRAMIDIDYTRSVEDLFLEVCSHYSQEARQDRSNSFVLISRIRDLLRALKSTPPAILQYIETRHVRSSIHNQFVTFYQDLQHISFLHPCTKQSAVHCVPCQLPPYDIDREEDALREPDASFIGHPSIHEEIRYHQMGGYEFQFEQCWNASIMCWNLNASVCLTWVRYTDDESKSRLTIVSKGGDCNFNYYKSAKLPEDIVSSLENRILSISKLEDIWKLTKDSGSFLITCTICELMYLLSLGENGN